MYMYVHIFYYISMYWSDTSLSTCSVNVKYCVRPCSKKVLSYVRRMEFPIANDGTIILPI